MKKLILTLSMLGLVAVNLMAQYCGNSGPSVCTPDTLMHQGLSPVPDSLEPIYDGVAIARIIEFQNYDTLTFQGHALTMDSLQILQITNLPSGLCWATNKVTNTFANSEPGCIKVTGSTCAAPGQYQLDILINAYTSFPVSPLTTSAAIAGLYYFVRVNCLASDTVFPIDTTHESTNDTILLYSSAPYNQPACLHCGVGIQQFDQNIQSLTIAPNPFSSIAEVSFSSAKAGIMTEKITGVIGNEVYRNQINVKLGLNQHFINRNALAAGVYFYTISDGVSELTKRVVISE